MLQPFIRASAFPFALNLPSPYIPADWMQDLRACNQADANQEDGDNRLEGNIGGEVGIANKRQGLCWRKIRGFEGGFAEFGMLVCGVASAF